MRQTIRNERLEELARMDAKPFVGVVARRLGYGVRLTYHAADIFIGTNGRFFSVPIMCEKETYRQFHNRTEAFRYLISLNRGCVATHVYLETPNHSVASEVEKER